MDFKEIGESLGLEEDEYIEMLEIFLQSGESDMKKLEEAVAQNDPQKAHEASHSFKGSTGSLGLDDLFGISKEIDDRCRKGVLDGVGEMFKQLQKEFDLISEKVKARL